MAAKDLSGSRIRERRLAQGMRQGDLAGRVGISASYLNLIEHNRRRVAPDLAVLLAEALGLDPAQLREGGDGDLVEELNQVRAVAYGQALRELEPSESFVERVPGWAGLTAGLYRRIAALEAALASAHDRMQADPFLPDTLHEVLSAASSVQATSSILTETEDLEPEWRSRFEANLADDSQRLARLTEALAAHLAAEESPDGASAALVLDEAQAFVAQHDWDFSAATTGLSSGAQTLVEDWRRQEEESRQRIPDAALELAQADPVSFAARAGTSVAAVFRRLALRPGVAIGYVSCDGAGALMQRKPVAGFVLPRAGAGCALWPLFAALRRPMEGIETVVQLRTGRGGARRFRLRAYGTLRNTGGFGQGVIAEAAMLIEEETGTGPALAVGPTCRICRETACPARREPSLY